MSRIFMTNLLLDTHALVWLLEDDARLGANARANIQAASDEEGLYLSSLVFWEMAYLVRDGRLQLMQPLSDWRASILSLGIQEIPLSGVTAIASVGIKDFHADPADRVMMATAQAMGATLVTADRAILAWSGRMNRMDAAA
jgi:PIN domain nuclease of toxin-antitoxin system